MIMLRKPDKFSEALEKKIVDLISTVESEYGVFFKSLRSKKDNYGTLSGFIITFVDEDLDAVDSELLDSKSLGEDIYDLIYEFEITHGVEFKTVKSEKCNNGKLFNINVSFESEFADIAKANVSSTSTNPVLFKKYHLQEQKIPAGFQIYDERLEVVGIQYRRDAAANFVEQVTQWVEFESEPSNKFDPNAIKVLGCYQQENNEIEKLHIGYIPANIAKQINRFSVSECMPRLLKTYIGESGYVEILIQVLGPKGRAEEYGALHENDDEEDDEYEDLDDED